MTTDFRSRRNALDTVQDDSAFFLWGYRSAAGPYKAGMVARDSREIFDLGGHDAVLGWARGMNALAVADRYGVDLSGGDA